MCARPPNVQFTAATGKSAREGSSPSPEPSLINRDTHILPKRFINSLSTLPKKDLEKRDIYGRALLHVVCLANKRYLLEKLLKNPNLNISITDLENHWNCLHYAIFYKNFIIAQILISTKQSLLQAKDREGFTPLDLMSSEIDIWKLKWVPESIGRLQLPKPKMTVEEARCGTREINLEKRFTGHQSFRANNTPRSFQLSRGGSNIVMIDSLKDVGENTDHLVLVDMRRLKYKYGDRETYSSLSERISFPRIRDVKMSKHHSIVLTTEPQANIFVKGLGTRGRLGLGNGQPQDAFVGIPAFEKERILFADVSNDHSICLTADGNVYTWGLNSYGQLGYQVDLLPHQTEACVSIPKLVNTGDLKKQTNSQILGVSCSKFHSLVYTKSEIYLWGLNVGQFGFSPSGNLNKVPGRNGVGLIQIYPRKLAFTYGDIRIVYAADSFTVVLTNSNELHFYLNGFHSKVIPPLLNKIDSESFNTFRPRVLSQRKSISKMVAQKGCDSCLLLLDNGDIMQLNMDVKSLDNALFQKSVRFTTIWKASKEHLRCTDVDMGNDGSIIISVQDGSAYKRIKRAIVKDSKSSHGYISKKFKFSKIVGLNKVVRVVSDPLFSRFAFIRDDTDLIPHRLAKSSILQDFYRLSPLSEIQDDRPVQRRAIVNKVDESYMSLDTSFKINFVYKTKALEVGEEETFFRHQVVEEDSKAASHDVIANFKDSRWTHEKESIDTVASINDDDVVREILKSDNIDYWLTMKDLAKGKHYDYTVSVDGVDIDVHREVLELRSEVLRILINQNGTLERNGVILTSTAGKLKCSGKVTLCSVLVVLHFLYTDQLVDVWTDYPLGKTPKHLQESKTAFENISKMLRIVSPMGRVECTNSLRSDLENLRGECLIKLQDATVTVFKPLVVARSAYFETLFSSRWNSDFASLPDINSIVFGVIVKYLYGVEYDELFNDVEQIVDVTSFINFALDVMDAAEQLILAELSDICQLLIKDFISLDNVQHLLRHSYNMKAYKLFANCLWFIYNNLDVLLLDPWFGEMVEEEDNAFLNTVNDALKWFATLKNHHREAPVLYLQDHPELIREMIDDMDSYNAHFIHPLLWDVFTPVFEDQAPVPKISSAERRRRSSARRIEENKANVPGATVKPRTLSKALYSQRIVSQSTEELDENAIADDDADHDLVLVASRKSSARSSFSVSSPIPMQKSGSISNPKKASPPPASPNSSGQASVTIHQDTPNTSAGSFLTLAESYGSPGNPGFKLNNPVPPVVKASSKSMPRLSQRERIKRGKQQQSSPTGFSIMNNANVWGTSSPDTPSKPYTLVNHTAVLASVPSFESVLLEEKMLQEKQNPQPVRSFEDIQNEERFEQWWAQESERVQRELQRAQEADRPRQNRRNSRKSSNSKDSSQRDGSKNIPRKHHQRRADAKIEVK
ncbi:hypothetical protein KL910_005054 [Ogataea haglerorum]|nr:hypothetical protein KL945_004576 [Ogataea haglerorum]KAG7784801.1 hypothetical protein KL910_005054 [Ogataea haglerorum]